MPGFYLRDQSCRFSRKAMVFRGKFECTTSRQFSHPGEGIEFKALPHRAGVLRVPGGLANTQPLRGDRLKGVLAVELADYLAMRLCSEGSCPPAS